MLMPMDLRDYVRIYDNFLEANVCKNLIEKLSENDKWELHQFYNSETKQNIRFDKELSVLDPDIPETREIDEKISVAIRQYFGDWHGMMDKWYGGWNGYTKVRYNRYDVGTKMKLHCDHIHSMFDGERKGIPTLSILGSLNNDYEGGELIFWEKEKIELKTGQIMIFPSNFMYPHRVDEVTKGTRYSYVSWVW